MCITVPLITFLKATKETCPLVERGLFLWLAIATHLEMGKSDFITCFAFSRLQILKFIALVIW